MRLFHKLENATYLPRDGISHPVIFFTILVPIHRARMQDSATSTTRATNTLDVENYITWAMRISQDKSMMEIFFSSVDARTARSLLTRCRASPPIPVERVVGGSDVVDNARQS